VDTFQSFKILPPFTKVLQSIISDLLKPTNLIKFEINICLLFYRQVNAVQSLKILQTFTKVLQSIISDLLKTTNLIKFEINICLLV